MSGVLWWAPMPALMSHWLTMSSGIGHDRRRVMTREDDIAARERSDPAVSSGGLDAFDALVAPDAVDPGAAQGQVPGPAGHRRMFGELRTAFADPHIVALYLTAGQNAGAFACAVTGTHGGELMGRPITGRAMTFRGGPAGHPQDGLLTGRRVAAASSGLRTQPGLGPQL
jgi:SnoaL-like polyketide cyclase